MAQKNKIVAALLAWFLGVLGVHSFYLGYTKKGVIQLILGISVILTFVSGIWALYDFIMILMGKVKDAKGNDLV